MWGFRSTMALETMEKYCVSRQTRKRVEENTKLFKTRAFFRLESDMGDIKKFSESRRGYWGLLIVMRAPIVASRYPIQNWIAIWICRKPVWKFNIFNIAMPSNLADAPFPHPFPTFNYDGEKYCWDARSFILVAKVVSFREILVCKRGKKWSSRLGAGGNHFGCIQLASVIRRNKESVKRATFGVKRGNLLMRILATANLTRPTVASSTACRCRWGSLCLLLERLSSKVSEYSPLKGLWWKKSMRWCDVEKTGRACFQSIVKGGSDRIVVSREMSAGRRTVAGCRGLPKKPTPIPRTVERRRSITAETDDLPHKRISSL